MFEDNFLVIQSPISPLRGLNTSCMLNDILRGAVHVYSKLSLAHSCSASLGVVELASLNARNANTHSPLWGQMTSVQARCQEIQECS